MRFLKNSQKKIDSGLNRLNTKQFMHLGKIMSPVFGGLISTVLSVINSGPNNYYGIDKSPGCTGSGMYMYNILTRV